MAQNTNEQLVTIAEAAALLGVPRATINSRIGRGDLTAMQAKGRRRLVLLSDVEALRSQIRPRRRVTEE